MSNGAIPSRLPSNASSVFFTPPSSTQEEDASISRSGSLIGGDRAFSVSMMPRKAITQEQERQAATQAQGMTPPIYEPMNLNPFEAIHMERINLYFPPEKGREVTFVGKTRNPDSEGAFLYTYSVRHTETVTEGNPVQRVTTFVFTDDNPQPYWKTSSRAASNDDENYEAIDNLPLEPSLLAEEQSETITISTASGEQTFVQASLDQEVATRLLREQAASPPSSLPPEVQEEEEKRAEALETVIGGPVTRLAPGRYLFQNTQNEYFLLTTSFYSPLQAAPYVYTSKTVDAETADRMERIVVNKESTPEEEPIVNAISARTGVEYVGKVRPDPTKNDVAFLFHNVYGEPNQDYFVVTIKEPSPPPLPPKRRELEAASANQSTVPLVEATPPSTSPAFIEGTLYTYEKTTVDAEKLEKMTRIEEELTSDEKLIVNDIHQKEPIAHYIRKVRPDPNKDDVALLFENTYGDSTGECFIVKKLSPPPFQPNLSALQAETPTMAPPSSPPLTVPFLLPQEESVATPSSPSTAPITAAPLPTPTPATEAAAPTQPEKQQAPLSATPQIGIGIRYVTEGNHAITFIQPGSPADQAGLQVGDVITWITTTDGIPYSQIEQKDRAVGQEVVVNFTRDGSPQSLRMATAQLLKPQDSSPLIPQPDLPPPPPNRTEETDYDEEDLLLQALSQGEIIRGEKTIGERNFMMEVQKIPSENGPAELTTLQRDYPNTFENENNVGEIKKYYTTQGMTLEYIGRSSQTNTYAFLQQNSPTETRLWTFTQVPPKDDDIFEVEGITFQPNDQGYFIVRMSPNDKFGLVVNDIVTQIDGQDLKNIPVEDFSNKLNGFSSITVMRDGKSETFTRPTTTFTTSIRSFSSPHLATPAQAPTSPSAVSTAATVDATALPIVAQQPQPSPPNATSEPEPSALANAIVTPLPSPTEEAAAPPPTAAAAVAAAIGDLDSVRQLQQEKGQLEQRLAEQAEQAGKLEKRITRLQAQLQAHEEDAGKRVGEAAGGAQKVKELHEAERAQWEQQAAALRGEIDALKDQVRNARTSSAPTPALVNPEQARRIAELEEQVRALETALRARLEERPSSLSMPPSSMPPPSMPPPSMGGPPPSIPPQHYNTVNSILRYNNLELFGDLGDFRKEGDHLGYCVFAKKRGEADATAQPYFAPLPPDFSGRSIGKNNLIPSHRLPTDVQARMTTNSVLSNAVPNGGVSTTNRNHVIVLAQLLEEAGALQDIPADWNTGIKGKIWFQPYPPDSGRFIFVPEKRGGGGLAFNNAKSYLVTDPTTKKPLEQEHLLAAALKFCVLRQGLNNLAIPRETHKAVNITRTRDTYTIKYSSSDWTHVEPTNPDNPLFKPYNIGAHGTTFAHTAAHDNGMKAIDLLRWAQLQQLLGRTAGGGAPGAGGGSPPILLAPTIEADIIEETPED